MNRKSDGLLGLRLDSDSSLLNYKNHASLQHASTGNYRLLPAFERYYVIKVTGRIGKTGFVGEYR